MIIDKRKTLLFVEQGRFYYFCEKLKK